MSIAESCFAASGKTAPGQKTPPPLTPYNPDRRRKTRKSRNAGDQPETTISTSPQPENSPAPVRAKTLKTGIKPVKAHSDDIPVERIINPNAHDTRTNTLTKSRKTRSDIRITPEIIDRILERLGHGEPIARTAPQEGTSEAAFYSAINRNPDYAERYAQARREQADALFGKILIEAEECDGTQEGFNRARIRIDAYKWICAKINPAKYSDKAQIAVTGADGGPLAIAATAASVQEIKAVRDMLSGVIDIQADEPETPTTKAQRPGLLETSTETPESDA